MEVILISTWKEIYVSESLLRGWMGTSRLITYNLELTWTIHFEMICMQRRIIGLLQSQDLDGKPTFGFIFTRWSVNVLFCLKAPRGGIVLVVVEDDRVLWRSTWFVEKEDWDFRSIELFLSLCLEVVTEDCRSRLYGNVLIKKYPPQLQILAQHFAGRWSEAAFLVPRFLSSDEVAILPCDVFPESLFFIPRCLSRH